LRYTAFGETRYATGITPTDYRYTGQREEAELGLYFYNARWYDPALGRFIQPDTIVPDPGNPMDWDRYAYVRNNPVNYTDPSGHEVCDEDGNCFDRKGWHAAAGTHFSVIGTWKKMIQGRFGIMLGDGGQKTWDQGNLHLMFTSLETINDAVDSTLRARVSGAKFTLNNQSVGGDYHGVTHTQEPSGIDFYTKGNNLIRQMNIFHEVGHLLDNTNGTWDIYTNAVNSQKNPSWVGSDKKINPDTLVSLSVYDPNYPQGASARQTYSGFGPSEQWADAFANYVAGNINLSDPNGPGIEMWYFVRNALFP